MANNNFSVAEWRQLVDVIRWEQRPFVVVDPISRASLLYLSRSEYQQLVITSLANAIEVTVVATQDTDAKELGPRVK